MFYRVVMNIIQMMMKVYFVSDDVVVKSSLPEFHVASNIYGCFVGFSKVGFERMHNLAEIALTGRANQQMKVVG